jgi:NADP-dependent 3-hydroxy acid dehydrogenase YdfG
MDIMGSLDGKVAWVTGAGSGIGEAGAMMLAEAGALVVLSGRRAEMLDKVAATIEKAKGRAETAPLDVADAAACARVAADIVKRHGRLDILVNSAGLNVTTRNWDELTAEAFAEVVDVNLKGTAHCVIPVLPQMRKQKDGVIMNIASWAGRFEGPVSGPAYMAAKHGVVVMTHNLNRTEGRHGIRCSAICPGEVATPILDKRPVPVTAEDRARMLQSEDLGRLIRFVAEQPPHVCLNEIVTAPTWNRGYIGR